VPGSPGTRDSLLLGTGLAAAVLVNYWIAGPVLGVDHDPGFSWISDFAARGEDGNWRFALLDALSGAAVVAFGALLWPALARGKGPGANALRWGLILLIASGAIAIADALLPESCGRSLGAGCVRADDLVDRLHQVESTLAVLVTGGAMLLIGVGLRRRGGEGSRLLAALSIVAGAVFLLLNALIALRFAVDAFDESKGWLQRGGQVVLGAWLIALALLPGERKLRG